MCATFYQSSIKMAVPSVVVSFINWYENNYYMAKVIFTKRNRVYFIFNVSIKCRSSC